MSKKLHNSKNYETVVRHMIDATLDAMAASAKEDKAAVQKCIDKLRKLSKEL